MLEQMAGLFYIAMVVTRLVGMRTARMAARDAEAEVRRSGGASGEQPGAGS